MQEMYFKKEISGILRVQSLEQSDNNINSSNFPETTTFEQIVMINNKQVSYELLYSIVGKKFHSCLKDASASPEQYEKLSDKELIH